MSGDNVSPSARNWFKLAEEELKFADSLRQNQQVEPRFSAYHAQQAAEKALKALLVARGVPFKKVHDLVALNRLLPATSESRWVNRRLPTCPDGLRKVGIRMSDQHRRVLKLNWLFERQAAWYKPSNKSLPAPKLAGARKLPNDLPKEAH